MSSWRQRRKEYLEKQGNVPKKTHIINKSDILTKSGQNIVKSATVKKDTYTDLKTKKNNFMNHRNEFNKKLNDAKIENTTIEQNNVKLQKQINNLKLDILNYESKHQNMTKFIIQRNLTKLNKNLKDKSDLLKKNVDTIKRNNDRITMFKERIEYLTNKLDNIYENLDKCVANDTSWDEPTIIEKIVTDIKSNREDKIEKTKKTEKTSNWWEYSNSDKPIPVTKYDWTK